MVYKNMCFSQFCLHGLRELMLLPDISAWSKVSFALPDMFAWSSGAYTAPGHVARYKGACADPIHVCMVIRSLCCSEKYRSICCSRHVYMIYKSLCSYQQSLHGLQDPVMLADISGGPQDHMLLSDIPAWSKVACTVTRHVCII